MQPNAQHQAAATAKAWLEMSPIFLDTETTGLQSDDEICELAIIDAAGQALVNTLIKPSIPIPSEAYLIHGITDQDVTGAPSMRDVANQLAALLRGRLVVIYNADFDHRLINQSLRAAGLHPERVANPAVCAMRLYARFAGIWNPRHGDYKWHRLEAAASQCHIGPPPATHRALADAETCRRLVIHMASQAQSKSSAAAAATLAPQQQPLNI
jgi:DNA polymerase-3 subunit epsilon